jgi:hypothetical protein
MEYNKKIAEIVGQDAINHDILYNMHNNDYAIYKVIGNAGSGKRTLCEHIADSWIGQTNGNVLYLYASYRQAPVDYSTFKNLMARSDREKKLLNIFETVLKDVPYFGNSLSAIATEVIDAVNKKNDSKKYTENEQYIFSAIKKISDDKDLLFLCFNYELWDLKSQHVLSSLLEYAKFNFTFQKTYFIFISEDKEDTLFDSKIHKKYLNKIQKEDIEEIARQFNPNIYLDPRQIDRLFELTEGNLGLIKESLDLFQTDSLPISHSFYDIIKKNVSSLCEKSEETLDLLKQAAFIGVEMDSRLLKIFSDMASDFYEEILDEAIKHNFLDEKNYTISFAKKHIYAIMKDFLLKERTHYLRLSSCLTTLYPSRYDLQMQYLYRGNLTAQADKLFFIYLIGYYRETSVPFNLNDVDKLRLSSNPLYITYKQICNCYQLYKCKNYEKAEAELLDLYCEEISFRFEKDYLLSLVVTNKYYTSEEFKERINVLCTYVTDSFRDTHPEMYLRAQMMLAEFYAETLNDKELLICLKNINSYFAQYAATDKKIQCYEHCFKLKANAFYKIEIAWKYTKDAFRYFEKTENNQLYLNKYYFSILNHSANEIILGNYENAYNMLLKAQDLICQNSNMKNIHEDILINNMSISGLLGNILSLSDCIAALEKIIPKNTEAADYILLKSNLAVFYAMKGRFDKALSICQFLYQKIEFNDDIDCYYRYHILNNYGIALWINQEYELSAMILAEAFLLQPLPRDSAYFKARSQKIQSVLKDASFNAMVKDNNEWNHYLYRKNKNVVGKAWKFWSHIMLFSELQIWSDF